MLPEPGFVLTMVQGEKSGERHGPEAEEGLCHCTRLELPLYRCPPWGQRAHWTADGHSYTVLHEGVMVAETLNYLSLLERAAWESEAMSSTAA